jgi:predicted KAP-like P-loop ATPase
MTNEKAIDINSTFNSDSPIESPEQDIFKRVPFAQGIAKVITNRVNPDSIVFGIYGEWGTGKTSVLNLIENELKKSKKIQCVKFNPWRFEDESSLILFFLPVPVFFQSGRKATG